MTVPAAAVSADVSFVSYRRQADATPQIGVVQGDRVLPLGRVPGFTADILDACEHSHDVAGSLDELVRAAFDRDGDASVALGDVELGPPVGNPEKIICLGLNYADHASEAGFEPPPVPIFFSKFRNALTGPFSPIVLPKRSEAVDFEGELAVVIGRAGKHIAAADALDHVAGYAVMNDVSARDLQLQTSQWTAGKTLDTFAPFGPGIVPRRLVADPQNLRIETRVNGTVMQSDSTASMVFSVAETIEFLSSLMTLRPGDIIATGTPAGVGFKREPPTYLRPGDVVEVAIEGIGAIRNEVISESPTRGSSERRRGRAT